mgnify:CR=1 FL=1
MSSKCDKLRAQALVSGLNSEAGRRWRRHAERCESCSCEIRILADLRDDARGNLHLDRSSLKTLLGEVDRRGRQYRRITPLRLAFQAALFCVIGACAVILYTTGAAVGTSGRNNETVSVHQTLDRIAADFLGTQTVSAGIMEFTSAFAENGASGATSSASRPNADDISRRLSDLRSSIEDKRTQLLEECDAALDESYWLQYDVGFLYPDEE